MISAAVLVGAIVMVAVASVVTYFVVQDKRENIDLDNIDGRKKVNEVRDADTDTDADAGPTVVVPAGYDTALGEYMYVARIVDGTLQTQCVKHVGDAVSVTACPTRAGETAFMWRRIGQHFVAEYGDTGSEEPDPAPAPPAAPKTLSLTSYSRRFRRAKRVDSGKARGMTAPRPAPSAPNAAPPYRALSFLGGKMKLVEYDGAAKSQKWSLRQDGRLESANVAGQCLTTTLDGKMAVAECASAPVWARDTRPPKAKPRQRLGQLSVRTAAVRDDARSLGSKVQRTTLPDTGSGSVTYEDYVKVLTPLQTAIDASKARGHIESLNSLVDMAKQEGLKIPPTDLEAVDAARKDWNNALALADTLHRKAGAELQTVLRDAIAVVKKGSPTRTAIAGVSSAIESDVAASRRVLQQCVAATPHGTCAADLADAHGPATIKAARWAQLDAASQKLDSALKAVTAARTWLPEADREMIDGEAESIAELRTAAKDAAKSLAALNVHWQRYRGLRTVPGIRVLHGDDLDGLLAGSKTVELTVQPAAAVAGSASITMVHPDRCVFRRPGGVGLHVAPCGGSSSWRLGPGRAFGAGAAASTMHYLWNTNGQPKPTTPLCWYDGFGSKSASLTTVVANVPLELRGCTRPTGGSTGSLVRIADDRRVLAQSTAGGTLELQYRDGSVLFGTPGAAGAVPVRVKTLS
jgi:hypothetical protein